MEQLHPGAKWLFRVKVYALIFFFSIWISMGFLSRIIVESGLDLLSIGLFYFGFSILTMVLLGELYARLAYKNWKYEFTPNEIKLERGIIWKRYSSIPYERVQNVDITRGILARIIGFSTLNIQTAGYHYAGKGGSFSEGYIPAVSIKKAEETRDFLMKKVGKRQGL